MEFSKCNKIVDKKLWEAIGLIRDCIVIMDEERLEEYPFIAKQIVDDVNAVSGIADELKRLSERSIRMG